MNKIFAFIALLPLMLAKSSLAQLPANFSWINIETDKATMAKVRRALHDSSITAIREVGLQEDFALVMTASREADGPTPDYDRWTIYNVALKSGKSRKLVSGYGVKLIDWIGPAKNELAIEYYDCWECEAAKLFTTLHFVGGTGWRARWLNTSADENNPHPGALVNDDGNPDEEPAQIIFAVIRQPKDGFAVGSWERSRNSDTGKLEDYVERYTVDATTGADRIEKLQGREALHWEREICTAPNILIEPSTGQKSKTCRRLLQEPTDKAQTGK